MAGFNGQALLDAMGSASAANGGGMGMIPNVSSSSKSSASLDAPTTGYNPAFDFGMNVNFGGTQDVSGGGAKTGSGGVGSGGAAVQSMLPYLLGGGVLLLVVMLWKRRK